MKLFRRLLFLLQQRQNAADLSEEMAFHKAQLEREYPEDAGTRLGNTLHAHEEARAVWLARWFEALLQDLAYGARSLRRQPAFTATAVLALVLGIGLNTGIFTVFNAIALRPWPVRDPARVVTLVQTSNSQSYGGFSVAEYRYLAENTRTLSGVILARAERVNLDNQPDGAHTSCHFVSGNYFRVLGVGMATGRGFIPDEDRAGAPQAVAVLSYRTWITRYAGDPHIAGRRITVEDVPFTVVGVAGEDFTGTSPQAHDMWAPISSITLAHQGIAGFARILSDPNQCCSQMAGRLSPGITRSQADSELSTLGSRFELNNGGKPQRVVASGTQFLAQRGSEKNKVLPAMALLMTAVFLVLLLACANVSNLLLARGSARRSEFGVRLALGAGRARIVRQLMTESLLLAAVAGTLGTALAWFLPAFLARRITDVPDYFVLRPDEAVLAVSVALAVFAAVTFGLAPALRVTKGGVANAVKQHTRQASSRFPLRGVLLGTQVAISVVLLISAGLLVRGLALARNHDPGFRVDGVTMLSVDLPVNHFNGARWNAFFVELEQRIIPFVPAPGVGFSMMPPVGNGRTMTSFTPEGKPSQAILYQAVNGSYFDVLNIQFLAGRRFVPEDRARQVAIINEAAARRYWPLVNPLGKFALINGRQQEIVGIARDAEVYGLGPVEPIVFNPFRGGDPAIILVRGDPALLSRLLPAVIHQAEPRASVTVETLAAQLERSLGSSRAGAELSAGLGFLALALAATGIYGVISYSVEQRRRELGVRMALGARPAQVVGFVLRGNSRAVAWGLAVGLALSVAVARLLHGFLFGLPPADPVTYASVLAILFLAGVLASVIPARKSARIDPLEALRHE